MGYIWTSTECDDSGSTVSSAWSVGNGPHDGPSSSAWSVGNGLHDGPSSGNAVGWMDRMDPILHSDRHTRTVHTIDTKALPDGTDENWMDRPLVEIEVSPLMALAVLAVVMVAVIIIAGCVRQKRPRYKVIEFDGSEIETAADDDVSM